jgi:hypothetical protein
LENGSGSFKAKNLDASYCLLTISDIYPSSSIKVPYFFAACSSFILRVSLLIASDSSESLENSSKSDSTVLVDTFLSIGFSSCPSSSLKIFYGSLSPLCSSISSTRSSSVKYFGISSEALVASALMSIG